MRRKLHELIYIIDRFNSTSKVVVDIDFENRLKELTERAAKLLKQAETANATDKVLVKQITQLDTRAEEVRMKLIDVWSNTTMAYMLAEQGAGNVSVAESSLNVSRHLLDMINKMLMDQGAKALNDSIKNANATGEQEKRMIEIVKEVKKNLQILSWDKNAQQNFVVYEKYSLCNLMQRNNVARQVGRFVARITAL